MKKSNKEKYNTPKRQCISAEVLKNEEKELVMIMYGNVVAKKNSKQWSWKFLLSSPNYTQRHKQIVNSLEWIEFKYNAFPCKCSIEYYSWDIRQKDLDNMVSSIWDTFTDLWIIPDDNHFMIRELEVKFRWLIKNAPIYKITLSPCAMPL